MSNPITDRERYLCQLLVSCCMLIHDPRTKKFFEDKDFNDVGDWIRKQLEYCGFNSVPMGSLHVYLTECTRDNF